MSLLLPNPLTTMPAKSIAYLLHLKSCLEQEGGDHFNSHQVLYTCMKHAKLPSSSTMSINLPECQVIRRAPGLVSYRPVRLTDKPWLKVLFADLL
jgi:hypothetical protein